MTFMTKREEEEFWRRHIQSRKIIDEDMVELSLKKKRRIARKIKANA